MKLKTNKLRDAVVLSLAMGAASLTVAGNALAQEATTGQDAPVAADLDTITVTGTRIKSQTMTASSPVAEIQAEEFQYSGATKVEDLVNQYPQLDPTFGFDNFQNNGSTGYATVDLRGLGPQRTLTLVNGRRIPKGLGETPDLSIVPAALVKRVDVLTGGASAVYGSDAIAGVVNFILDDEFEGLSATFGYSGYQHKNDNKYIQGLMDERGFSYPTGDSGLDGKSRDFDLAVGSSFGEGGHAMAWFTWRKNDALLQGQRDYSSCALNAAGTRCGGSATADPANFYVIAPSVGYFYAARSAAGAWTNTEGTPTYLYNYAPINYFQRPDTRLTAGTRITYEVNEHFKPYFEGMFVRRKSSTQIAPSGAFFTDVTVNCSTPQIGTMCGDLGITDDEFTVYVAKRNVEGGPRITNNDSTNFSGTFGAAGDINDRWSYDASYTFNQSNINTASINDFVTTRVQDALLGCPAGSFDGCIPYDVWTDSVTPAAAQALQDVGVVDYRTSMQVFNAYASGDLGFGLPSADGEPISLVAGYEWRKETYERSPDYNVSIGNFTGVGGPTTPLAEVDMSVNELFLESSVPLLANAGPLSHMDLQLGYRYSDYKISGGVSTYKVGLGANFLDDKYRFRAGYNQAIREPSLNEFFAPNQIALWGGDDPCAGATPEYTAAQCANTGVTAAQYGLIAANPASQNNQYIGGNPDLQPETAKTWTAGFAANPIKNLELSVDYYDIKLEDAISTLGARNILDVCALNGTPEICSLIRRNATTGDLFRGSDPETSGLVYNTNGNFGSQHFRGVDLTASYAWDLGPGRLSTSLVGSYLLKREIAPVPGDDSANYDCAGIISPQCQSPKWRHVASARYSYDRYTVGLRWRYMGKMDYENPRTGEPLTTDFFLKKDGEQKAYNYIDLSGSVDFGDYITWTLGVNNVTDKEPPMVGGNTGPANANSLGGYDQAGRYVFTSVSFKFD